MARLKGKQFQPTRKQKAKARMRKVAMVFIALSVIFGGIMIFNMIAGPLGHAGVVKNFGGEAAMKEMSLADLQRPYYAYVNSAMDNAETPFGKVFGFVNNIGCLIFLWKTSKWFWGVGATVWFTCALFYELLAAAICGALYLYFYRVVNENTTVKKGVDLQKEMNQKDKEEAERLKKEAERRKAREKDPNQMSDDAWKKKQERIALRKRQEKWDKANPTKPTKTGTKKTGTKKPGAKPKKKGSE